MITPSLALAGLAEAAMEITLMLNWGVLLLVGIVLAIGFKIRGRKTTIAALVVYLIYWGLFQPWTYFHETDPGEAALDGDIVYWDKRFNRAGYISIAISIAALPVFWVSLARTRERAKKTPASRPADDDEPKAAGA